MKHHNYNVKLEWSGNLGSGTDTYNSYSRNHIISCNAKYDNILGSSDSSFKGEKSRYNPEELFLSSIMSCHMLWYLHLCASEGIVVTEYIDEATAVLIENRDGSGYFKEVKLNPVITIENDDLTDKAHQLHQKANNMCFIANSCNFKIEHHPKVILKN